MAKKEITTQFKLQAPGGKATAIDAAMGTGTVAASDVSPVRAGLVAENASRLGRPSVWWRSGIAAHGWPCVQGKRWG